MTPSNLPVQFCTGCGASLAFDPAMGQLKCPYCGHEEAIAQASKLVEERSFDQFVNANRTQIAVLSSTALEAECPGCRAQITFQPPDVAGLCPFCATSIVAQPHSPSPVITPEAILPFSIDAKTARTSLQKWLNSRWFAPNGLKKLAQTEGLQGVYLPFWTYDCHTRSQYRGDRGDHYYVTETYTETDSEGKAETKTREVQHTRWHSVSGTVDRAFDDILVLATKSFKGDRLACLQWDLSKLVSYNPSYLSGFKAQRYQVDLKNGFEIAKGTTTEQIQKDVRCDIGGDEQRIHSIATAFNAVSFKHLLLPVWISSYRFRNRQYQVMINAQSGKVLGERPYSKWKIAAAVMAALAVVAIGIKIYSDRQTPSKPIPARSVSTLPSPAAPAITPSSDAFRQAINLAGKTATQSQNARTRQDWQQIANQWRQTIVLLQAVPSTSANYPIAQRKIGEYRTNLNYALQQANRP